MLTFYLFEDREENSLRINTNLPKNVSLPLKSREISTQTPISLSSTTPRKTKLRETVRKLRRKKSVVSLDQSSAIIAKFAENCDNLFPEPLATFMKVQAQLSDKKAKGGKFSLKYTQFALSVYFLGPRAYQFLRTVFYLPSKSVLQRMTQGLVYQTGISNEMLFHTLETKINTFQNVDKHCILCMDAMSIKGNLFYHLGRDEIMGFHDIGDGNKCFTIAQNAFVIMIRGIHSKWKQPLAYFFVHSSLPAENLMVILENCIKKLFSIGLIVNAVVSDMSSSFIRLSNMLNISPNNSEFYVEDNKILYIFDTPHLIKATRNNLLQNNFQFNNYKTSWAHIKQFYEKDKLLSRRCVPKLTNSHLDPTKSEKMKVKLATQIFSNSVASCMHTYISLGALPAEAIHTVEVLQKFNNLFDMLNSSIHKGTKYRKPFHAEKYQIKFLNEMTAFIKEIRVVNKKDIDITPKLKFLNSWLVTINSVKILWEELEKANYKFLATRRLNQDCLENFFVNIRQQSGNCVNPTSIQFEIAFKTLFCQNYFHSENTEHTNCAKDFDNLLAKIIDLEDESEVIIPVHTNILAIHESDYKNGDMLAQNSFKYVCSYLLKKAFEKHSCEICEQLTNGTELNMDKLLIQFKAYEDGSTNGALTAPREFFLQFVYKLERIFVANFEKYSIKDKVGLCYFNDIKEMQFQHECSQFPIEYIKKLFLRLRIFYALKFANCDLNSKEAKKSKSKRKIKVLSYL